MLQFENIPKNFQICSTRNERNPISLREIWLNFYILWYLYSTEMTHQVVQATL